MVERGYVEDLREAFDYYLGDNGKVRAERGKLPPREGLRAVQRAGGIGVMAHPRTVNNLKVALEELVEEGLAGIEVYAEKYTAAQREEYAALANRYDLVHSGGTDYHGFGTEGEVQLGELGPPCETPALLLERAVALHGEDIGWVPDGAL